MLKSKSIIPKYFSWWIPRDAYWHQYYIDYQFNKVILHFQIWHETEFEDQIIDCSKKDIKTKNRFTEIINKYKKFINNFCNAR